MSDFYYTLTEKDLIAIKVATEYQEKNNVEYSKIVLEKIRLLLKLINSLYEEKIDIPVWKVWSEALIHKLCFHSTSLLKLYEGTTLPFENMGNQVVVLDKSSIISLLRVVTENYLTFNFLYANNISDVEKQFRLSVWRYCGIKQRVEFDISTEKAKKKQAEDVKLLEELKAEVVDSVYFKAFTAKEQQQILKGRKPRLFNSWIGLIKQSGLRVRLFKNMYGYKSNYSHSEFISVFQINSGISQYNPNENVHSELILLHLIICKTIVDLKDTFPSILAFYSSSDSKIISEVDFLNRFASEEK